MQLSDSLPDAVGKSLANTWGLFWRSQKKFPLKNLMLNVSKEPPIKLHLFSCSTCRLGNIDRTTSKSWGNQTRKPNHSSTGRTKVCRPDAQGLLCAYNVKPLMSVLRQRQMTQRNLVSKARTCQEGWRPVVSHMTGDKSSPPIWHIMSSVIFWT